MVISCAPARVLTAFFAQRPNASEPPVLFIRSTMMPRTTRNTMMAMLPASETVVTIPLSPSTSWTTVSQGWKLLTSSAPTRQPRNREEYTSLEIRASTMATMGGSRDQKVPAKGVVASIISPSTSSVGSGASLNMTPRITSSTIKTPSATKYAILVLFFSIVEIYLLMIYGAPILACF